MVYNLQQQPLITGLREPNGAKLRHIALRPSPTNMLTLPTDTTGKSLKVFSAYDIPSVEALVLYFHATAGFTVRDT